MAKELKNDIKNKQFYYCIRCNPMDDVKIQLTSPESNVSVIGISSKKSIKLGLRLVDKSPFKTIFVLDEETGSILYALSKNKEYVESAKKRKKPKPKPPTTPPETFCCMKCRMSGGTSCQMYDDGSCICFYGNGSENTGSGLGDDALSTLSAG